MAVLTVDETRIVLREAWAGTLVVTSADRTEIRRWGKGLSRGLQFDVTTCDELWIFRTYRVDLVMARLKEFGWNIES